LTILENKLCYIVSYSYTYLVNKEPLRNVQTFITLLSESNWGYMDHNNIPWRKRSN